MGSLSAQAAPTSNAKERRVLSLKAWLAADDRQLCRTELRLAKVGKGSTAGLREIDLDAEDLPVEATAKQPNSRVWHVLR